MNKEEAEKLLRREKIISIVTIAIAIASIVVILVAWFATKNQLQRLLICSSMIVLSFIVGWTVRRSFLRD
jgi:hypothetical protein